MRAAFYHNKSITITDRTLTEAGVIKSKPGSQEILNFCRMLKEIGADLVEIDAEVLRIIGKPSLGAGFLFRILKEEDLELLEEYCPESCVLGRDLLLKPDVLHKLASYGAAVTMEIRVNRLEHIAYLGQLKELAEFASVKTLRITGLSGFVSLQWMDEVRKIRNALGVKIDVCPENRYSMATALAVDAAVGGFAGVSATFAGCGGRYGYAALEEVLAALMVLKKLENEVGLKQLPELSLYFTELTGIKIPSCKPVVGAGIFEYEAGIHADGIGKYPATYEPFEPESVGSERRMSIGKHSGSGSVYRKMRELGIDCKAEEIPVLLKAIRERSILAKRSLRDEEIKQLYEARVSDDGENCGYHFAGRGAEGRDCT